MSRGGDQLLSVIRDGNIHEIPSIQSFFPSLLGYRSERRGRTLQVLNTDPLNSEILLETCNVGGLQDYVLQQALVHMVEGGLVRDTGRGSCFDSYRGAVMNCRHERDYLKVKDKEEAAAKKAREEQRIASLAAEAEVAREVEAEFAAEIEREAELQRSREALFASIEAESIRLAQTMQPRSLSIPTGKYWGQWNNPSVITTEPDAVAATPATQATYTPTEEFSPEDLQARVTVSNRIGLELSLESHMTDLRNERASVSSVSTLANTLPQGFRVPAAIDMHTLRLLNAAIARVELNYDGPRNDLREAVRATLLEMEVDAIAPEIPAPLTEEIRTQQQYAAEIRGHIITSEGNADTDMSALRDNLPAEALPLAQQLNGNQLFLISTAVRHTAAEYVSVDRTILRSAVGDIVTEMYYERYPTRAEADGWTHPGAVVNNTPVTVVTVSNEDPVTVVNGGEVDSLTSLTEVVANIEAQREPEVPTAPTPVEVLAEAAGIHLGTMPTPRPPLRRQPPQIQDYRPLGERSLYYY